MHFFIDTILTFSIFSAGIADVNSILINIDPIKAFLLVVLPPYPEKEDGAPFSLYRTIN